MFQRVGQREQEQQKCTFDPFPECPRSHRGQEHEEVDVESELPLAQCLDQMFDQFETAEHVGGQIEADGNGLANPSHVSPTQATAINAPQARLQTNSLLRPYQPVRP